jgi:hypothetical protein
MLLSVHAIEGSASTPSLTSMESEWILGRWRRRGAHFHWHHFMDKTEDRAVITQLNRRSSPSAIPVVSHKLMHRRDKEARLTEVPGTRETNYDVDEARQPFFSPGTRPKASQTTGSKTGVGRRPDRLCGSASVPMSAQR